MARRTDLAHATREDIAEMMRQRQKVGAAITVLGIVGLFAMVHFLVPGQDRVAETIGADVAETR